MNTNTTADSDVISLDAARYDRLVREQARGFNQFANEFPPSSASYAFFRAVARDDMQTVATTREAMLAEVGRWDEMRGVA